MLTKAVRFAGPLSLFLPCLVFFFWYTGSRGGWWSGFLLPPPWRVWDAFTALLFSGKLANHIASSLSRVAAGFSAAFVSGYVLGAVCARFRWFDRLVRPSLSFFRHLPPLALSPLLILWFGIGNPSKIVIVWMSAFFPVYLNTLEGFASVPPELIELARSLRFGAWRTFYRIELPSSLPTVLVGVQLGLGFSWRALVGAELIAASSGLGYLILDAQQLSRTDVMLVGVLVIGVMGVALDSLVALAVRGSPGLADRYRRGAEEGNVRF